ncbi:hypothetical protein [Flavobacterium tegetincola]|uniref:hypothetical protein n=1 Tax=Flavobacterium tegetincola TaxID=150172 RepID=UPI0003F4ED70|nr:hypothetical protein [Flavobacterium tegetincola]
MNKIDLLYGFLIGIIAASLGVYLFLHFFTDYEIVEGFTILRGQGQLGKLIALGAILNLVAFFLLLKFNKELMARGVVLATLVVTIATIFA